tara:strand:+ start:157 stop:696 length:540 start_codon:yes stop_codon:yes gene_type:complete
MIIPQHNYTQREQTVCNLLLQKTKSDIGSLINVGFHDWQDPRKHWWIKICEVNKIDWSIIEVFEPNVQDAITKGCPKDRIYNLSITDVDKLPAADLLMFWHGPEHLLKEDFLSILPKLEEKYQKLIFGMPLGEEPQGKAYGNPHECHISAWESQEWRDLGYEVIEVYDQRYPHITTYKL